MGASKADKFSEEENELAAMYKALGHPARIAIWEYLQSVDSCICGDIVNELPLAQPTVSQHLKEMKSAGLIKGSVEGTSICYCINPTAVERMQVHLGKTASNISTLNNCC